MDEQTRALIFKKEYDLLVEKYGIAFSVELQMEKFNNTDGHSKAILILRPLDNWKEKEIKNDN